MTDAEKKPKEFWIFKGTSNFCSELEMNEEFAFVKAKPEGFYDIVALRDTVDGGIHTIEFSAFQEAQEKIKHLEARVEKLRSALEKLTKVDTWFYYYDKESMENLPPMLASTVALAALKEDEK